MNTWHVLTDGRKYWGAAWAGDGPRSAMTGLQDARLCFGPAAIELETRRAWDLMRVTVWAVAVKFVRGEKETRVELETNNERASR